MSVIAEDEPVDIWNINKKEIETNSETNISKETIEVKSENSVYQMQTNKKKNPIKLDQKLVSKDVKISGLYDPEEYGLSIDMWSNSDGSKLKNLFESLDKYNLSMDASEILNFTLFFNFYIFNCLNCC